MKKKIVWIFLGIPMCGKGLTGSIIESLYRETISLWVMRTLIGREKESNAEFANLADTHERVGTLLPDDGINNLLRECVNLNQSELHIFDGAGRNLKQMKYLIRLIHTHGVSNACIRVVHFKMTEGESMNRFAKKCNASDRQGRQDADPHVHRNRIRLHLEQEPGLLDYLKGIGTSICEIDAASNDVLAKVSQILDHAGLNSDTGMLREAIQQHLPEEDVA